MINGFFRQGRGPEPYVRIGLDLPLLSPSPWVAVSFLVDTGASQTCLHPRDATTFFGTPRARLLDPNQWPRVADSGGVGGAAIYFPLPVRYGFVHTDGREEIIEGTIAVGQLTATNEWIPSLMGWDLLQHFRLDLHGRNKTVSLDRV